MGRDVSDKVFKVSCCEGISKRDGKFKRKGLGVDQIETIGWNICSGDFTIHGTLMLILERINWDRIEWNHCPWRWVQSWSFSILPS